MGKITTLDRMIKDIEPLLLGELREDYNTLSFIKGFVHEGLNLPEKLELMTEAQKRLQFKMTIAFIYHLLKNRNVKMFQLEREAREDGSRFLNIVEVESTPEEAVNKMRANWSNYGIADDQVDEPWFKIEK